MSVLGSLKWKAQGCSADLDPRKKKRTNQGIAKVLGCGASASRKYTTAELWGLRSLTRKNSEFEEINPVQAEETFI